MIYDVIDDVTGDKKCIFKYKKKGTRCDWDQYSKNHKYCRKHKNYAYKKDY